MVGEHGELGIGMAGYTFTQEVRDLLHAIAAGWTKVGQ